MILIINNYSQDLDPMHTSRGNPVLPYKRRIEMIDRYIEKLSRIGKKLQSKGVNVVVMLPLPNFNHKQTPFNLRRCKESNFISRMNLCRPSYILRKEMLKRNSEVVRLLSQNADRGGYIVLNPFDAVCPEKMQYCSTHLRANKGLPAFKIPIFRDGDHISAEGARVISISLEEFFTSRKYNSLDPNNF